MLQTPFIAWYRPRLGKVDGDHDIEQVLLHEHDTGGFNRDIRPRTYGDTDVRLSEGW